MNFNSERHLENLNPPQLEAVKHERGPILILAGAGSGKTRVLTRRVVNLVITHRIAPYRILAVTFTNKASQEMRERLEAMLGADARQLWVSTFHSTALRILRQHAKHLGYRNEFVVFDDDDSKSLLKEILKTMNLDEKRYPPALFSRVIDQAKNSFILPPQFAKEASGYDGSVKAEVYDRYQRELLKNNAMDFGDLLVNVVRLFMSVPEVLERYRDQFHYLLVDEFQDTNEVQYRFLRLLAEPRRNLFVVGDDDQSIYAFRGANITNILGFEKDFPEAKVVKLEQNYRSTSRILESAHAVIKRNLSRKPKKLWTSGAEGPPVSMFVAKDENEEAYFVAREIAKQIQTGRKHKDIAVFYRTNAQSRALEDELLRSGIPYRIYGGLKFYDRKEIRDIIAYLRLIHNPDDGPAFMRVVNTPTRGIGAQALRSVVERSRERDMTLLAAAETLGGSHKGLGKFVELMTKLRKTAEGSSLSELIERVIEDSEYGPRLRAMNDVTAQSRHENLLELVAVSRATEFGGEGTSLQDFLDKVSLTASNDAPTGEASPDAGPPDSVSLMTLHLAKGLEYPTVFLTGFEQGLLPHHRSIQDPSQLEEERRLCYVGITRAMEKLYVSRARYRGLFSGNDGGLRQPSQFAYDLPSEVLESVGGGDFFSTTMLIQDDTSQRWSPSGDIEIEGLSELDSFIKRKAPAVSKGRPELKLVKADDLGPGEARRRVALAELTPGMEVFHPTLGRGVITELGSGDEDTKVSVRFDGFPEAKKLLFKFAKLEVPVGGERG